MARKKGTQALEAYNYIKEHILTFEYLPGDELSDSKLEQEMKMSRSPIREAIIELIADGLLIRSDGKVLVAPLNLKDIIEICEVRKALEISAIKIVARKGGVDSDCMTRLRGLIKEMNRANTIENYKLDDEFHSILLQASGNSRIVDITNKMRLQISRARWLNVLVPGRMVDANKEHESILDALENGDAEECGRTMKIHMDNSQQNFEAVLNNPQFSPHLLRGIAMMMVDSVQKDWLNDPT